MDKIIPLLGPSIPALGMRSAQDPSTLPPGVLSRIENFRCQNGTFKVRDGALAIISTAISGATACRGLYSATIDGASYLIGAFRNASDTRVYRFTGAAWAEVTGASTRFATDGDVGFCVVRDRGVSGGISTGTDVLVMGVTGESPRVAYGASLGTVSTVTGLTVPLWVTQTALPYAWMVLSVNNGVFDSQSTVNYQFTVSSPFKLPSLLVNASAADGDTATLLFRTQKHYDGSSGTDGATLQKEIVIASGTEGGVTLWEYTRLIQALVLPSAPVNKAIATATNAAPVVVTSTAHGYSNGDFVRVANVAGSTTANGTWRVANVTADTFELEDSTAGGAGTGGTVTLMEWVPLWDATGVSASMDSLTFTALEPSTGEATANVAAILTGTYEGRQGWAGIRLTANGPATASTSFEILTVATSGQMDGRSLFAVSYYNSASRAEGVAQEASRGQGSSLQAFGGVPGALTFQWNPGLNFRTSYQLEFPGSDDLTGTPNYALIYRSDPYLDSYGEVKFGQFFYSGAKSLPASEPLGGNDDYVVSTADDDVTRLAKDVGHLSIPSGGIFAGANGRLFVAGTSSPSELWVSADQDPFQFRMVPNVDDDGNQSPLSATYRTFAGEKVTAMLRMQGDILGVDSVLLWTDRGVYRLGGFDSREITRAGKIDEVGSYRGPSIAPDGGQVWYLDSEGQVRITNGALASDSMTELKVDDLLTAGTLTNACGIAAYDAYRLFFQEAGASDIRVSLVWQKGTKEWVLDRFPFAIGGVVRHGVAPRAIMYAAEPTGKLWRLETPSQTTENGADIVVRLDFPELSAGDLWTSMVFGAMGIVMDGSVNATLTTTRTVPYTGATFTGSIDLTTGALTTASAWRKDTLGASTEACFSCIPKLTGSLPGGKRIRALNIEARVTGAGGADRA